MSSDEAPQHARTVRDLVGREGIPWLTLVVLVTTVAVDLWTFAVPSVEEALRRDPDGLGLHNLWRLATPLLTQTDGWVQAGFNWLTLAVFGPFVEWMLGRWRWAAIYLGAGLVGQALGYRWEPAGGGSSVAVAGLVGGLAVTLLVGTAAAWASAADAVAVIVPLAAGVAGYGLVLAGVALAGWPGQLVAVVLFSIGLNVATRRLRPATAARLGGIVALAAGAVLVALADHHGASMLTGAILTIVCIQSWLRPPEPAPGER